MSTAGLIRDLLAWIPRAEQDHALRDVMTDRQATGDHESVRALAAVLDERRAERRAKATRTWTEEDGA